MPLTKDEISSIQTQLTICIQEELRLSEWENEFIDSISKQFADNDYLSPRQLEVLKRIYDKVV